MLTVQASALRRFEGPLARTAAELEQARRVSAFQRRRELVARRRLRESDLLLDYIEQCRMRHYSLLPTQLWIHIVRFIGGVDPTLRDDLGINRHPDHVTEVLFSAQERLLAQNVEDRRPRRAPIIPLFGPRPANREGQEDGGDGVENAGTL